MRLRENPFECHCEEPKATKQSQNSWIFYLVCFCALLISGAGAGYAQGPADVPFAGGERLVYDISWYGVSGGSAVMELKPGTYRDRPVFQLTSTAKSNSVISLLYPVSDQVESLMDAENLTPLRMRSRLQEGGYRADREIFFDRERNVATFVNHRENGDPKANDVPPMAQDPLSVLYYFRTLPAVVGKTVEIDVHDGHKNWKLLIHVLGKERIWTPAGAFETLKTRASIKYQGLFVNKGDVTIWFTDDGRRIPVLMESKIKIGHITATLMQMGKE